MYVLLQIYLLFPFFKIYEEKDKKYLKYFAIFSFVFSFGTELLTIIFGYGNRICSYIPNINFNNIVGSYSPITRYLNYFFYFFLGWYLHNKLYGRKQNTKTMIKYIGIYGIGLFLILVMRKLQTGHFLSGDYIRIINDYCKIGCLLMATSVFCIFARSNLKENKIVKFIGQRTMNIYFIHMLVVTYFYDNLLPIINITGAKANIIRTIIVVIISIGITEVLKKIPYLNKALGIK